VLHDELLLQHGSRPADLNQDYGSRHNRGYRRCRMKRNAEWAMIGETLIWVEVGHLNGGQQTKQQHAQNRDRRQSVSPAAQRGVNSRGECPQTVSPEIRVHRF